MRSTTPSRCAPSRHRMALLSCLALSLLVASRAAGQETDPRRSPLESRSFKRGDADCDGVVDAGDARLVLGYSEGVVDTLCCPDAADADDDGEVTELDVLAIQAYLEGDLSELPVPGASVCGPDPTPDALSSSGYPAEKSCAIVPCCLPDWSCVLSTRAHCLRQGGVTVNACKGDSDGDGYDDACQSILPPMTFRRGDANSDGVVDIGDAIATLGCQFLGRRCPDCLDAADANDDGEVDIADAVAILACQFLGRDCREVGRCVVDSTPDGLDCQGHPCDGDTAVDQPPSSLLYGIENGIALGVEGDVETVWGPLFGFIEVGPGPQPWSSLSPGESLKLWRLGLHAPLEAPLGVLSLELDVATDLTLTDSGRAEGVVPLRVGLLVIDAELVARAFASLAVGPNALESVVVEVDAPGGLLPFFEQGSGFRLHASLSATPVSCDQIEEWIEELDHPGIEVRDRATNALLKAGKPALEKIEKALEDPVSLEQQRRLEYLVRQIRGVTSTHEWIGDDLGVDNFTFKVTVTESGAPWTAGVCDFHLVVGTAAQTGIDHGASTLTHDLPDGWRATYDAGAGEYQFDCALGAPLEPGKTYTIEIRTPSMHRPDGEPKPIGWYWTDKKHRKIGDAGTTIGPRY